MTRTREQALSRYPELGQLIAGEMERGGDRSVVEVVDPTTGKALGLVTLATESDVDRALTAAKRGFEVWRKTSAFERAKVLRKVAEGMRAQTDRLAELLVLELGKPWQEAVGEVEQAAGMWEWAAEEGRRAYGRIIPSRESDTRHAVAQLCQLIDGDDSP